MERKDKNILMKMTKQKTPNYWINEKLNQD